MRTTFCIYKGGFLKEKLFVKVWKFNGDDKELNIEDRNDRFLYPNLEKFSLQLFSPVSWEAIPGRNKSVSLSCMCLPLLSISSLGFFSLVFCLSLLKLKEYRDIFLSIYSLCLQPLLPVSLFVPSFALTVRSSSSSLSLILSFLSFILSLALSEWTTNLIIA